MSLTLNTNLPALNSLRHVNINQNRLAQAIERLSSGLRINGASDDPAGLAIVNRAKAQISGLQQAQQNVTTGISMLQISDGAMSTIITILQDIRTSAVQSSNGTNTSLDRAAIQSEVNTLLAELNRVASSTQYNTIKLTNGSLASGTGNLVFQVGPNGTGNDRITMNIADMRASALDVSSVNVSTASAATAAIAQVDSAINAVSSAQTNVGANLTRLSNVSLLLGITEQNYEAARSAIEDADLAEEVVNFTKSQLLVQSGTAFLAQANVLPGVVFSLLVGNK